MSAPETTIDRSYLPDYAPVPRSAFRPALNEQLLRRPRRAAVQSNVGFAVGYIASSRHGTFNDVYALVTDSVLKRSAKVASVEVKDPNLEAHLETPDFFDAERHRELTFQSKSIERDGDQVRIDGEITIEGHTDPVELTGLISDPIADPDGGERFGFTIEAMVVRDRFGVSWNNPLPSGEPALANEVTLTPQLQFSK